MSKGCGSQKRAIGPNELRPKLDATRPNPAIASRRPENFSLQSTESNEAINAIFGY